VDESIYQDIEDLESAFDMIKKLEEINQEADELIVEKLIKKLKIMKPRNYMEVLKCLSDMLNTFNKLKTANYDMSENDKIQYMFKALPKELQIAFLPEPGKTAEEYYDLIKSRNIFIRCMNEQKIIKPQINHNNRNNYNNYDDPMDLDLVFNRNNRYKSHRQNNSQRRIPNKYCHICNQRGHLTSECHYNGRTNGTMNQTKFNNNNNNDYNNRFNNNNYNNNKFNNNYDKNNNKNYKNNNKNYNKNYKNRNNYINNIENNNLPVDYDDDINYENLSHMINNSLDSVEFLNNLNKSTHNLNNYKNDKNKLNKNFNNNLNNYESKNNNLHKELNNDINYTNNTNYINNYDNNNNCTTYDNNESTWIYDSGTIVHITNNRSLLTNFKKYKINLTCANNSEMEFEGFGAYKGSINGYDITLSKVFYSRHANKNLISGIQFTYTELISIIKLINNEPHLIITDNDNNIINTYRSIDGRNTFRIKINNKYNNLIMNTDNDNLWHRRLGHFYHKDLSKFIKEHTTSHNNNDNNCITCGIAKMKRLPHNRVTPKATKLLDIIHSDIVGPFPDSFFGFKFIITFIDEFSRKAWIFTMKRKSDAIDIIINFFKYLNNLFPNYKITNFKSDQGKEYCSRRVNKFCKKNGIRKLYSPPRNPQNNGIAERFNQTILYSLKCLLSWSKLNIKFWDFAIRYSKYLYNLTPHSGINNQIPNEVFYGTPIHVNHIKVFGCIAYYKDFSPKKGKLDPNAKKGFFLGFSNDSNSYLIMDYNNFSLHQVREVLFQEDTPACITKDITKRISPYVKDNNNKLNLCLDLSFINKLLSNYTNNNIHNNNNININYDNNDDNYFIPDNNIINIPDKPPNNINIHNNIHNNNYNNNSPDDYNVNNNNFNNNLNIDNYNISDQNNNNSFSYQNNEKILINKNLSKNEQNLNNNNFNNNFINNNNNNIIIIVQGCGFREHEQVLHQVF